MIQMNGDLLHCFIDLRFLSWHDLQTNFTDCRRRNTFIFGFQTNSFQRNYLARYSILRLVHDTVCALTNLLHLLVALHDPKPSDPAKALGCLSGVCFSVTFSDDSNSKFCSTVVKSTSNGTQRRTTVCATNKNAASNATGAPPGCPFVNILSIVQILYCSTPIQFYCTGVLVPSSITSTRADATGSQYCTLCI
jgi:hypothetical protein